MTWNSTYPDGSLAVKDNRLPGQQNTTYIETTMAVDHYWNEGVNLDGHHSQVQMPLQASDVTLGASMDGAMYLKQVGGTVQGFYKNAVNVYQFIPGFLTGTVTLNTSSFTNIVEVPDQTYGDIYLWLNTDSDVFAKGSFKAYTTCYAYSNVVELGGSPTQGSIVSFGNGDQTSGLNIRAKALLSRGAATLQYRVVYWGM